MKNFLINWLNRHGIFTIKQHLKALDERDALAEYAEHLEKIVNNMSDPAKPIIVMGENTVIRNISLQKGQSVVVSPRARYTHIEGVFTGG